VCFLLFVDSVDGGSLLLHQTSLLYLVLLLRLTATIAIIIFIIIISSSSDISMSRNRGRGGLDVCNRKEQLRPRCRHLANWTKHNVMFDSAPFAPLCENMTSSTKPEIHNVLHSCHQRRTQPRPQLICTEYFVTFGHMVLEISERTDNQTKIQMDRQTC